MRYILLRDGKYMTEGHSKYIIDSYENDILKDRRTWTLEKTSHRSFNTLKMWEVIPENDTLKLIRIK